MSRRRRKTPLGLGKSKPTRIRMNRALTRNGLWRDVKFISRKKVSKLRNILKKHHQELLLIYSEVVNESDRIALKAEDLINFLQNTNHLEAQFVETFLKYVSKRLKQRFQSYCSSGSPLS